MEQELINFLDNVKLTLDEFNTRLEVVEKRMSDMEHMIITEILDPAKNAMDAYEHSEKVEAFKEKCGDKIKPYEDFTKAVNGEDFDIYDQAMTGYEEWEGEKPTEEEYIDGVVEKLASDMASMKDLLNADTVEIKVDDEGAEVIADGETVTEAPIPEATPEAEEPKAEEMAEGEEAEAEEEMDSPEEVQADLEALAKEMAMYKKPGENE